MPEASDTAELVKRLRADKLSMQFDSAGNLCDCSTPPSELEIESADRLEALQAEVERSKERDASVRILNDVLNQLWEEMPSGVAAALGVGQIDKIMEAQNAAFALTNREEVERLSTPSPVAPWQPAATVEKVTRHE